MMSGRDGDEGLNRRLVIHNVHLDLDDDGHAGTELYDVVCVDGIVDTISPAGCKDTEFTDLADSPDRCDLEQLDAEGRGILLPALCHGHIHLDKCFLLDKCDDLVSGDFTEALKVTAKAKSAFPADTEDLYDRGKRLITESVECGVTLMRAHVEVDRTVNMCCLEAGLRLRDEFQDICDIQIAAFAQDPLFASLDDERPGRNLDLLRNASKRAGVQAVGSAPYVEPSTEHAKRNIKLILDTAIENRLHVDFHLDYNLDLTSEPLIWYVLEQLHERIRSGRWHAGAHVCIGHATRLTLFSADEWTRFCQLVCENDLPVTLVGLPPSDLYMMGRNLPQAPRSTLNVPKLAREYGLKIGMSVNNIENAFTPQGPLDPLALCPLGVAIFQAGTRQDCRTLLEAVTLNTRTAIGHATMSPLTGESTSTCGLVPTIGNVADFVLLHDNETAYSAALNPSYSRTTIKAGVIVSRRLAKKWLREKKTVQSL
ncbi:hypothetical protein BKA93DRAFT_332108 [Sparassis latifolia]